MAKNFAAACQHCGCLLTPRDGNWWHIKQKNNSGHDDFCTQHYWKLSRGKRKLYRKIIHPEEQLGNDEQTTYVRDFSAQWWGGKGARVAVLCGGGWYDRGSSHGGGGIQACDQDSVEGIVETLTDVGFEIVKIDISQLGSGTGAENVQSELAACCVCIVPGGHDVAQAASLGDAGKAALASFLRAPGGGMVGICAGAWLLGHGDSKLDHNFGWLPVGCDPRFGDNGLEAMISVEALDHGVELLGAGLQGDVYFDESPSLQLLSPAGDNLKVLARYGSSIHPTSPWGAKALEALGREARQDLVGSAAVICGISEKFESRPRMVLIGPHWEVTPGECKGHVVSRAVAWAAGLRPE